MPAADTGLHAALDTPPKSIGAFFSRHIDTMTQQFKRNAMKYFTYLLRCADGSLYCDWTNDLAKRFAAHNAGTASKYTRSRLPVTMVYAEAHGSRQEAMRREYAIKHMARAKKEALITAEQNLIIIG